MRMPIALLGCLLAGATVAQPLRVQLVAAHNDKLHKSYSPYTVALSDLLGETRLRRFQPNAERRVACQWDGIWQECGYLLIRNASLLEPSERIAIRELMLDPCPRIERAIAGQTAIHPNGRLPTSHADALRRWCRTKNLSADAVRVAEMNSTVEAKYKPSHPDDLALEARIQPRAEEPAK